MVTPAAVEASAASLAARPAVAPQQRRWTRLGWIRFGWSGRDWFTGLGLFAATAAVILWQNAHVAVLWDLSYVLDTANRIALGQMPYRDFPLAHAPLTFLIQAALIRLTGRVYWHPIVYVAAMGGMGTVLAWRIALAALQERVQAAWSLALLLTAPLTVLGMYCILPHPSYDCDCAFWMLVAIWALQRLERDAHPGHNNAASVEHPDNNVARVEHPDNNVARVEHPDNNVVREWHPVPCPILSPASSAKGWETTILAPPSGAARGFCAGALACLPLFFKQNMGLPFLAAVLGATVLLLILGNLRRTSDSPEARALWALFGGVAATLAAAALLLHFTAGIGNYLHWTIGFAAQRRLPGLGAMLGVYRDPSLLWTLPCLGSGLVVLGWRGVPESRPGRKNKARSRHPFTAGTALWSRIVALALLAAPFVWTLGSLLLYDDADERGDALLALWPMLLIAAAAAALWNVGRLRAALSLRAVLPFVILCAVQGTLMSQQLWGSTYAIWPLLVLLLAELMASLACFAPRGWLLPGVAWIVAVTLLVCGGLYTASEERLSYAQLPPGPTMHSANPQLAGLATPGQYLPDFDELLRYAAAHIPFADGLILLPGEDPFYYATGRVPRFPVLLFDPATDPYSPDQVVALVRSRQIRWLIVKRDLQLTADPTPGRAALRSALGRQFTLTAQLRGYDVYRR